MLPILHGDCDPYFSALGDAQRDRKSRSNQRYTLETNSIRLYGVLARRLLPLLLGGHIQARPIPSSRPILYHRADNDLHRRLDDDLHPPAVLHISVRC